MTARIDYRPRSRSEDLGVRRSASVLGAFTQQAHNLILLSQDEARMLGRASVMPEHLLLALTRHGNVRSLLAERGVRGSDIYAATVGRSPVGDDLVLGTIPLSATSLAVLERAVDVAAERGVLGPSSEHLLLALSEHEQPTAILHDVGIDDPVALVDSMPGEPRPPVSSQALKQYLLRAGERTSAPRPGPVPPVFERYTAEAQRAVRAAVEVASLLEHGEVEPVHLLLGCLHVPDSLAAQILDAELAPSDMGTVGEAMERARMYGSRPAHQATGIFTDTTRRIVAQDALSSAYRFDHPAIGTGHLLLAALDADDHTTNRIVGTGLMGSGPVHDRLARAITRALPGEERIIDRVDDGGVIAFDLLIRILTDWFRQHLPPGWEIRGRGRSGGFRLRVPDSRSEEDFRVDMGWILTSDQPGRQRLVEVTHHALAGLQTCVASATPGPWPAHGAGGELPAPHAEIAGDRVNPTLRLWYGPPDRPVLELAPRLLLNMILHDRS
jgi:Clp amino terminal domain, pathogenicity island component